MAEHAVGGHDRVDIGGVEQRQARSQERRTDHLELRFARSVRAREAGEQGTRAEPRPIGRVADEHRTASRRAEHTSGADRCSYQTVDQGRLTSTGGPADHRQQRGVDAAQARDQVVIELRRERPRTIASGASAGQVERECCRRHDRAQLLERAADSPGSEFHG
jgi:hypothetical protein